MTMTYEQSTYWKLESGDFKQTERNCSVVTREHLRHFRTQEKYGIRLVSVYEHPDAAKILYDLLREREPYQNIRHTQMPSFEEHCAFLRSKPYQGWYLVEGYGVPIGSVYLSKKDEIGIFIFKAHQNKGRGARAIVELKRLHPRPRYLANIAIPNSKSLAFFTKQGFRLCSVSMEYRNKERYFTRGPVTPEKLHQRVPPKRDDGPTRRSA